MRRFRHFLGEVWRVRWMLLFALAVVAVRRFELLPEDSVTLRTLYRPAIGAMGFVVAHVGWSQVFPYLDMGTLLQRATSGRGADGKADWVGQLSASLAFGAVCVARAVIYAAFVVGAMLAI